MYCKWYNIYMTARTECANCGNPIAESYFFCPYCGRKLKTPPPVTSAGKQILLYFTALLLPLFAIAPGIAYVAQKDEKSKIIGIVALLTAGISFLVSLYFTVLFYRQFSDILLNPLGQDTILNSLLN